MPQSNMNGSADSWNQRPHPALWRVDTGDLAMRYECTESLGFSGFSGQGGSFLGTCWMTRDGRLYVWSCFQNPSPSRHGLRNTTYVSTQAVPAAEAVLPCPYPTFGLCTCRHYSDQESTCEQSYLRPGNGPQPPFRIISRKIVLEV